MITRKQRHQRSPIEEFVDSYIMTYFQSLEVDDFVYLDELYRTVASRIASLRDVKDISLWYLDDYSIVKCDIYMKLFNKSLLLAELTYRTIPHAYEYLSSVVNNILEEAESLSAHLTVCEDIVKTLEGGLREKMSIASIKDEILIYDTIGTDTYMTGGTLSVDKRAGCVTLAVSASEEIPFEVAGVSVNRTKGIIERPEVDDLTWKKITNGYFTSRTFSEAPLFENDTTKATSSMKDGDLETGYTVEYNSESDRETFTMNVELSFNEGRLDVVNIVADPSDLTSVSTSSVILPDVTRIMVKKTDNDVDLTERALDNKVDVRGSYLGEIETAISHKRPDVHPTGSFFLCEREVTGLSLELSSSSPQAIHYPEKVIKDSSGNTLHRFNYFETLVLNKYEPPIEHLNPRDFYTDREVTEMNEIMSSGTNVYDEPQHMFRYFIGIKEIQLLTLTYSTKGDVITADLNTSGKSIAGADLYVNEYVPQGTSVKYYLSPDRVEWHEIAPASRVETGDLPRRIVFEGFDAVAGDLAVATTTDSLYLKVAMEGSAGVSPVLKSYAVRIKLQ